MARKNVSAATVRTWAKENGIPVGKRGRLNPEAVEAFHKANKRMRYEVGAAEHRTITVEVPSKDSKGRNIKRKRTLTLPEARALIGVEGKRGRISKAALVEALTEQ